MADPTHPSFYSHFENAEFVDQQNKSFDFNAHKGKLMLVNFIFTHCSTVCPVQTRQLSQVRSSLSPSVLENTVFVSVSLDPVRDTPTALKHFVNHQNIDTFNWHFITGQKVAIDQIAERLKLIDSSLSVENPGLQFDHETAIWLIDQDGRVMMRYSGAPVNTRRVVNELEQLDSLSLAG